MVSVTHPLLVPGECGARCLGLLLVRGRGLARRGCQWKATKWECEFISPRLERSSRLNQGKQDMTSNQDKQYWAQVISSVGYLICPWLHCVRLPGRAVAHARARARSWRRASSLFGPLRAFSWDVRAPLVRRSCATLVPGDIFVVCSAIPDNFGRVVPGTP